MKKDLSRFFSSHPIRQLPLGNLLAAGVLALAVTGLLGTGTAVALGALPVAIHTEAPEATPEPTPTMTPDPAWQNVNWRSAPLQPNATATPVPDTVVTMELSTSQQSIGLDLYETLTDVIGRVTKKALKGTEVTVTVTCTELTEIKDKNNRYDTKQSILGTALNYTVAKGSLLIQNLNPGTYKLELVQKDGFRMPAAQTIVVKEKKSYKVDETVKPVNDGKEDPNAGNGGGNADAGVDRIPTVQYAETSGGAPITNTVYSGDTANSSLFYAEAGSYYLYDKNGNKSPFRAVIATLTGADGKPISCLTGAEYDKAQHQRLAAAQAAPASAQAEATALAAKKANGLLLRPLTAGGSSSTPEQGSSSAPPTTPTPEPTATPTPEPTPTPSPEPSATPTPEPSADASPTPSTSPEPSSSPSASPEPTALPEVTPPAVTSYTLYDPEQKQLATPAGFADTFAAQEIPFLVAYTERTGWHTIDGAQFYFDPTTHKYVTGSAKIGSSTYLFAEDGKLCTLAGGIDVSKFQGSIDWKAVKAGGIEFAIIRAGYRGWGSAGSLNEDPTFATNIKGAKAAGLRVGVYFFSQATTEEEAIEEASLCIKQVRAAGVGLNYPIYFDSEYGNSNKTGRADGLTKAQRTACAVAFCETIRSAGYRAGVYASESWFAGQLNFSTVSRYSIWNAHYGVAQSGIHCDIWQYTGKGRVPGISTDVDMNYSYFG